jgi:hypothetical protein
MPSAYAPSMLNPLAPPATNGVMDASPYGCLDVSFNYVYPISLTGGQLLSNQSVSILTEPDFLWRGLLFTALGSFSVRFQDGQQYYLSNDLIVSTNLLGTAGDPFPVFPEVFYPAGGKIVLDIQDTSGSTNTGQLIFIGAHRYKVSR